ncbi:MAG: DsbA family protein [Acidobacteriaceae bacterium]
MRTLTQLFLRSFARRRRAPSPFTSLRLRFCSAVSFGSTLPFCLTLRWAAALLVPAIFIGALGVTPVLQAQHAAPAAAADPHNAAPPPKAEAPPPAESTIKPAAEPSNEPTAEILARIANSTAPERGAHNAKVTIIFFDDMQCPYSGFMYLTLFDEVMKDYADRVRVVWKSFPLTKIHPWALRAAIDGECLAAQNRDAFWAFADTVHSKDAQISTDSTSLLDGLATEQAAKYGADISVFNQCLAAQSDALVQNDIADAKALGVKGTPTLFVNGERLYGSVSARKLRATIDQFLGTAGPSVSPVVAPPKAQNDAERNNQVLPVDFSGTETGLSFAQPIIPAPKVAAPNQNSGGRNAPEVGLGRPNRSH